jgi:actin-like ATPase involved in cell morphogenesis
MTKTTANLKEALGELSKCPDQRTLRQALGELTQEIPRNLDTLELFAMCFEEIERMTGGEERLMAQVDLVKRLPAEAPFIDLYTRAVEAAALAVDDVDDQQYRITEIVNIAQRIPRVAEYEALRVHAWRLALGLPERPHFKKPDLGAIAKRLPKTVDYTFYRRYTLLGIASQLPRDGVFLELYKEAIQLAIKAANTIPEPYYRKYALEHITKEIEGVEGCTGLHKSSFEDAYRAAGDITDPFAREIAYIDLLGSVPKDEPFVELLDELLARALDFFNVRAWVGDIDVYDVVDYVLSAEEIALGESRQKRLLRENYSGKLSAVLETFGSQLKDTRFIGTLKPYTHVWIQPKSLRSTVRRVVAHLESLRERYHGMEIERPAFIEYVGTRATGGVDEQGKKVAPEECISVDLGATNTVVMRKSGTGAPEFVQLPDVSRSYGSTIIVPTLLSSEVNTIGTEVADESPLVNIKRMLMEESPGGAEYVERFLKILHQHLKKAVRTTGWFTPFSHVKTDIMYITVPVGFIEYRKAIEGIVKRVFRGVKTELIEEPLAAAVGYQVAEEKDKVIMVIDFGGCTLDAMVLRLNINEIHVVAKPDMAQMLGGHDIDVWLAEHLAGKIGLSTGNIPYMLLTKAEEIKIALSKADTVPFEWCGQFITDVTREDFEELLDRHDFYRLVDRGLMYVLRRAEKVGLKKGRIEAVLLTGGSSQIPSFKDKVGHIFQELRRVNGIYDHSPLSAVAAGAALYGTRDIVDRHLGMAYAIRYATVGKEELFSYSIVLEKGESLPLEKSFRVTPARNLGSQKEISVELYEVPESLVSRRWVSEDGVEYLRQELGKLGEVALNALKPITLSYDSAITEDQFISIKVDDLGNLSVKYGPGPDAREVKTGVRLQ